MRKVAVLSEFFYGQPWEVYKEKSSLNDTWIYHFQVRNPTNWDLCTYNRFVVMDPEWPDLPYNLHYEHIEEDRVSIPDR